MTIKMDRRRYLVKLAWGPFAALLICGCVGKKPDDDVALIKQALLKFERGINQRSETVLDSIIQDKRQKTSSELLDSLYSGKEFEGARIANKRFVIVRDSAEVRLKLSLECATDEKKSKQIERSLKLFLHKKKGKWKIQSFSMGRDEEQ